MRFVAIFSPEAVADEACGPADCRLGLDSTSSSTSGPTSGLCHEGATGRVFRCWLMIATESSLVTQGTMQSSGSIRAAVSSPTGLPCPAA